MPNSEHFRSVAFELTSGWASFAIALAKSLKRKYGSEVHFYVRTSQIAKGFKYLLDEGTCDSLTNSNILFETVTEKPDDLESAIEYTRDFESRTGYTINRLTFGHRQFSRGYLPSATLFPRSRLFDNVSYEQMICGYAKQLQFWEREFAEKKISMFFFGQIELAAIAKWLGVPYRQIDTARYQDYWMWVHDDFFMNPMVARTYDEIEDAVDFDMSEPYAFSKGSTKRIFSEMNLFQILRKIGLLTAHRIYFILRRHQSRHSFRYFDRFKMFFRSYFLFKKMTSDEFISLDELRGTQFAFFPLHKEPEAALFMMSPEYINQMSAILSICRDLPAGVPLVVKEHPKTLGLRPKAFYDQLRDIKNVKLMNLAESGLDVVREAALTISITGSAGFEAAVNGKPVITFGRHNIYNLLPHVETIFDEDQIKPFIDKVFSGDFDEVTAKRDGKRLIQALLRHCWDMGGAGFKGKFNQGFEEDEIMEKAIEKLLESLEFTDAVNWEEAGIASSV